MFATYEQLQNYQVTNTRVSSFNKYHNILLIMNLTPNERIKYQQQWQGLSTVFTKALLPSLFVARTYCTENNTAPTTTTMDEVEVRVAY